MKKSLIKLPEETMKIKIIDNRKSLIEKCKKAGFDAIHGDYFEEIVRIPRHVICSASNPSFSFGGGFDLALKDNFPFYCYQKQKSLIEGNERIGNICFLISVDRQVNASEELVRSAIRFAIDNTGKDETLCLMGLGCFIGGFPEDDFVRVLGEELEKYY